MSDYCTRGDLCLGDECESCFEDDEEFCSDCFAGMESSEHHQKCEATR